MTLALLVASMSVGTGVLILMETDPARPAGPVPLWAVEAQEATQELALVRDTGGVPLQFIKWDNVVVHSTRYDAAGIARGCHFLIGSADQFGDGTIRPTDLWRRQQDGDHIRVPGYNFNANSVGICLLAGRGRPDPTPKQMDALIRLARALQITCSIPQDHVYLHSDLSETICPGERFDAGAFRDNLVPSRR